MLQEYAKEMLQIGEEHPKMANIIILYHGTIYKSFLYLEAAPYVEDMLDAELSGDWESWMEV
jgi:hypothetical protein